MCNRLKLLMTIVTLSSLSFHCRRHESASAPVPDLQPYDGPTSYSENSPYIGLDLRSSHDSKLDQSAISYLESEGDVTVEKILGRTSVSQPWMKDRVKTLLENIPQPALNLAKCSKLLVIDKDVKVSYTYKGVVWIRGAALAFKPEDRTKSPEQASSRSFEWDYFWDTAVQGDLEKTAIMNASGDLIHEWIHACDHQYKDRHGTDLTAQLSLLPDNDASKLFSRFYLNDPRYPDIEKSMPFAAFGAEHMNTKAMILYDYYMPWEHFAMLGEVLLMHRLYGVHLYEAIVTPTADVSSGFYKMSVGWGVKDKFCQSAVRDEARRVLELLEIKDVPESADESSCQPQLLKTDIPLIDSVRAAGS